EAERIARDKSSKMIPTQIQEAMDENLSTDVDAKEWNWQAMSNTVNGSWSLKTTDRQLKQIGRDNLAQYLIEQAEKAGAEVDLTKGAAYLQADGGRRSLCDWVNHKFNIKIDSASLEDLNDAKIKERITQEVHALYRQKEIEFPVTVAMARYMSDKAHA